MATTTVIQYKAFRKKEWTVLIMAAIIEEATLGIPSSKIAILPRGRRGVSQPAASMKNHHSYPWYGVSDLAMPGMG
jgi:hypothetical protein